MSKKVSESRRNFLRTSVAGAAGMAIVGPMAKKTKAANVTTAVVNLSTTPINQEIDNLRVAWITDTAMLRNNHWGGFDSCNNPANTTTGVVYETVKANMDKLACALANKTGDKVNDAWSAIFKIPATKTWATAKAALKVNCFAGDFPSVAIVAKICEVLIAKGMPAANIRLLDGGASGVYSKYTGAGKQIPAGITFDNNQNGDTLTFPDNSTATCASALSQVDIIVDIGVNKGHDQFDAFSGVTMSLKNHYWTFNNFGHDKAFTVLARNNACDHLLGKISTTYPAKQQLCIVDSLWLGDVGQWTGSITDGNNACSIVMSTFAGAADYIATMKIRTTKIAANTWNQPIVDRFITDFGYGAAAKTTVTTPTTGAGPGLVDAKNIIVETLPQENAHLARHGYVQFSVSGNGIKPFSANLYLAKGETPLSAEIYSVQGRKVRTLALNGQSHIVWDGKSDAGSAVNSGSYVVRVKSRNFMASGQIIVRK